MVDDISHEGLREVLQKEEVSFQAIKTWEQSDDPDYEAKKNRVLELYDIAEGKALPGAATRRWCSPWTSSARSTCCPGRASSGRQWCAGPTRAPPRRPGGGGGGPPTSAPRACATCSPRST